MNFPSLMEWNAKPPLPWDWENLITFDTTTENAKKLRVTDWEIDGEKGIESLYSSGGGSGSGGFGSDLGLVSLSKSSKSVSEDLNSKIEFEKARQTGTSPSLEASVGSGEPLLSLKLGKRAYFEDVSVGSNSKSSSFPMITASSGTLAKKRSKSSCHGTPVPRCQVEGCDLDLSSAKDYHRKHRVCESHSKCPKVIVAGLERRFCQQCSRFHSLLEFDEKKRSCRRRLSDHNARRRKPQPESIQLNPARLASTLYDERQRTSLVWNRASLVHAMPKTNLTWENTSSSKFTISKEYILKPPKVGSIDRQLHLCGNRMTSAMPLHCQESNGFLPSNAKGTTAEVLNQGLEESIISSNVDATQDLHRALSLLSSNSWGSCEPKSVSLQQPMYTNTSTPQYASHALPQGLPIASSEYWRTKQQSTNSQVDTSTSRTDGNSYFQGFQQLRSPCDSDFFPNQLN